MSQLFRNAKQYCKCQQINKVPLQQAKLPPMICFCPHCSGYDVIFHANKNQEDAHWFQDLIKLKQNRAVLNFILKELPANRWQLSAKGSIGLIWKDLLG